MSWEWGVFFSSLFIFPLGMLTGGLLARHYWRDLTDQRIEKYRKRWLDALELMQSEGKISEDQLQQIAGAADPKPILPDEISTLTQEQLYSMKSYDRAALEIARAEDGLPPRDDLSGMKSYDILSVEEARQEYRHLRTR